MCCLFMQVDSLFRVNHTDPWVKGDPYRTSRTISLQNTRTSGNPVHGRAPDDCARPGSDEEASPEGSVVVARLMGGVEYGRPLATGWTGTLGVNWQRAKCLDEHGHCITQVVLSCLAVPPKYLGSSILDVVPRRTTPLIGLPSTCNLSHYVAGHRMHTAAR